LMVWRNLPFIWRPLEKFNEGFKKITEKYRYDIEK